jgi:hypothetical protein
VDILGALGNAHVVADRAALLREPAMSSTPTPPFRGAPPCQDAADGDNAGAADTGHVMS